MTAELIQKEAQLDDTTQAAEKKKQELKSLQAQTKAATATAVTVQELEPPSCLEAEKVFEESKDTIE